MLRKTFSLVSALVLLFSPVVADESVTVTGEVIETSCSSVAAPGY